MLAYKNLLLDVLNNGEAKASRAGDTIFLPHQLISHDCRNGFPAITGRKFAFKTMAAELDCFIHGLSDINDFHDRGCSIWDANLADYNKRIGDATNTDLGFIYGNAWTNYPISHVRAQPKPRLREGLAASVLGVANGKGTNVKRNDQLYRCWNSMIARCYDQTNKDYHGYGANGVYVANEWLEFAVFASDVTAVPGWHPTTGHIGLQLDKDKRDGATGYCYSKQTCQWLTREQNKPPFKPTTNYVFEKDGVLYKTDRLQPFASQHGLHTDSLSRLARGKRGITKTKGFTFISATPIKYSFNQLAWVLAEAKRDPSSRRLIVSAWHPTLALDPLACCLPPCHTHFQLTINNGTLDLLFYMRSVDLALGLPFDLASYALLQALIARELGLVPRIVSGVLCDAHIYRQNLDAVHEYLDRPLFELPTLVLDGGPGALVESFHYTHARLENYLCGEAIKTPMAV